MEATMSRKKKDKEINFWPAYVDALINVVLNLLFLVGVFTIGLVVLNGEAFNQEKKIAELKVRTMQLNEEPISDLGGALDILKATPVMAKIPPLPPLGSEKKVQRERLEIIEIRVSNPRTLARTDTATDTRNEDIRAEEKAKGIAQSIAPGKVVMRIDFDINQYTTPKNFSPSAEIVAALKNKYLLLCIADPNNQRMSREAFARLMSIRISLTQVGVDTSQIAIQVALPAGDSPLPSNIDRSVFVIDLLNQSIDITKVSTNGKN
jgi:hypothetical protein